MPLELGGGGCSVAPLVVSRDVASGHVGSGKFLGLVCAGHAGVHLRIRFLNCLVLLVIFILLPKLQYLHNPRRPLLTPQLRLPAPTTLPGAAQMRQPIRIAILQLVLVMSGEGLLRVCGRLERERLGVGNGRVDVVGEGVVGFKEFGGRSRLARNYQVLL